MAAIALGPSSQSVQARHEDALTVVDEFSTSAAQLLLTADYSPDPLATLQRSQSAAEGAAALATDTMHEIAARLIAAGASSEDLQALALASAYQGRALGFAQLAGIVHDRAAEARFDVAFGEVAGHA